MASSRRSWNCRFFSSEPFIIFSYIGKVKEIQGVSHAGLFPGGALFFWRKTEYGTDADGTEYNGKEDAAPGVGSAASHQRKSGASAPLQYEL